MSVTEMTMERTLDTCDRVDPGRVVLSADGLRKAFGGQVVLDDISLELKQGQVVLLRGENGSGKTTLLNIVTGNLEPDSGEIHVNINGSKESFIFPRPWWKQINPFDHFTPERLAWEGIGRLWQDIRLFPTMKTIDNVVVASPKQTGENPAMAFFPGTYSKERENRKTGSEWLEKLGLTDRIDSSCDKISLGQMKRVAIARAIQAGAKVTSLQTHQIARMGLSYLRAHQQAFSSLKVKDQKKLAGSSNSVFDGSLDENSKGGSLSGGEKQKLLIDLLPDADVYLLDEPMIGLDEEAIEKVTCMLSKMTYLGKAVLLTVPKSHI